jgi:hypothetical protein
MKQELLAKIDLRKCAFRGRVLDPLEPDQRIEKKYFAGWRNLLTASLGRLSAHRGSAMFNLIEDDGRPALEWTTNLPFLLVAGDEAWGDVELRAETRCIMTDSFPYFHDEMTFDYHGRTGVAFRAQDSRRHYFAGFDHGQRVVIAAREDANWIVLNSAPFSVDRRRWYALALRCAGDRFELRVDGELWLTAQDARWRTGPAGLYSNTVSRWAGAEVLCAPAEVRAAAARRRASEADLRGARRRWPGLRKLAQIALPPTPAAPKFAAVLDEARGAFLIRWEGPAGSGLAALERTGRELWRREWPGPGRALQIKCADIDLDGAPEAVVMNGDEILVLDGATGATRAAAPYPEGCPFIRHRGEKGAFKGRVPYLWQLAGPDRPARIVLFEYTGAGAHTIVCLDHNLNFRWRHLNYAGKAGHDLKAYDVDGDGRLEVVAAYYAVNDEGETVWRVRDQDLVFKQDHADNLFVGPMDAEGRGPAKIVASCGEAGAMFVRAATGDIFAQRRGLGHVQRLAGGRFRPESPGVQVWLWTDWGSPSIYYLFDENATLLHRFQPDPLPANGVAVTWRADGAQLLLIQGTRRAQGLWDGQGRRIIDLVDGPGLPPSVVPTETGLPVLQPFDVCRLLRADVDQLVTVADGKLIVFGPK